MSVFVSTGLISGPRCPPAYKQNKNQRIPCNSKGYTHTHTFWHTENAVSLLTLFVENSKQCCFELGKEPWTELLAEAARSRSPEK